jgi:hypothetical protein
MSVEVFPIGFVVIAVAAGLLAVFAVWAWNRVSNPQTRSQGFTAVALVVGLLVFGLYFMRSRAHSVVSQQHAQVHSGATPPADFSGRIASGNGGQLEVRAESSIPGQVHHQAPVGQARMTTWAIVAILVGGVVLLITSRKSLPAALAGLGIIAGLVVMFAFTSMDVQTARTPAHAPAVMPPVVEPPRTLPAPAPANEKGAHSHAEHSADATSDHPSENERASTEISSEVTAVKTAASPTETRSESPPAEKNEPRPAWVGQTPKYDKATAVYRVDVVSGPYSTEEECERRLNDPLRGAMMAYADRYLRPGARYYAWLDAQHNRNAIIKDRYLETTQASFGPMLKLHALVEIGQNDVARYERMAHEADIHERVAITGTFAASLIGVLAVAYGALRYFGCKKPAAEPGAVAPDRQPATTDN